MRTERASCPLCGMSKARPWGAEGGWSAVACEGCGLVYVNPRPSDDEVAEANKMGLHHTEAGKLDVVGSHSRRKVVRYHRLLSPFCRDLQAAGRPVRWLDIGAGFGEVVEALQRILPPSSVVEGIEPMLPKAAAARARGLPVTTRLLSECEAACYDGASLINVFSHLPEPRSFLCQVRERLRPGGRLVIETGNGADLPSAAAYPDPLYLPDHLVFAGRQHMERFLVESGFKVDAVAAHRLDTVGWAMKGAVKRLLRRQAKIRLPYTSAFRSMLYLTSMTT